MSVNFSKALMGMYLFLENIGGLSDVKEMTCLIVVLGFPGEYISNPLES